MKTKIAYAAAAMAALTVPLVCFGLPMSGCIGSSSIETPEAGTDSPSTGTDAGPGNDSSTSPPADGGGDGGLCTGCTLVPLTATSTGYVDYVGYPLANTVHVIGSYYVYGDGWGTEGVDGGVGVAGERGNCELMGGFPVPTTDCETAALYSCDCSSITSPLPPAPQVDAGPDAGAPTTAPTGYANGFPPTPTGSQTFCMSGTAAAVPTKDGGTGPDYSDVYGIGIGFDFNNVGGVKSAYPASDYNVVGVQFKLSSTGAWPSPRVEFPTTDTNASGEDSYDIMPAATGTYTVIFSSQLAVPYPPVVGTNVSYMWPGDSEPQFKADDLLSIQVHVPTNTTSSVTVDGLCISDLSAVVMAK